MNGCLVTKFTEILCHKKLGATCTCVCGTQHTLICVCLYKVQLSDLSVQVVERNISPNIWLGPSQVQYVYSHDDILDTHVYARVLYIQPIFFLSD